MAPSRVRQVQNSYAFPQATTVARPVVRQPQQQQQQLRRPLQAQTTLRPVFAQTLSPGQSFNPLPLSGATGGLRQQNYGSPSAIGGATAAIGTQAYSAPAQSLGTATTSQGYTNLNRPNPLNTNTIENASGTGASLPGAFVRQNTFVGQNTAGATLAQNSQTYGAPGSGFQSSQGGLLTNIGVSSNLGPVREVQTLQGSVNTGGQQGNVISGGFRQGGVTGGFQQSNFVNTGSFVGNGAQQNAFVGNGIQQGSVLNGGYQSSNAVNTGNFASNVNTVNTGNFVSNGNTVSTGNFVSNGNTVNTGNFVSNGNSVSTGNLVSNGNTISNGNFVGAGDLVSNDNFISGGNGIISSNTISSGSSINGNTISGGSIINGDSTISSGNSLSSGNQQGYQITDAGLTTSLQGTQGGSSTFISSGGIQDGQLLGVSGVDVRSGDSSSSVTSGDAVSATGLAPTASNISPTLSQVDSTLSQSVSSDVSTSNVGSDVTSGFVSDVSSSLVSDTSSSLVSDDSGSLISDISNDVISDNSNAFVSEDYNSLVSDGSNNFANDVSNFINDVSSDQVTITEQPITQIQTYSPVTVSLSDDASGSLTSGDLSSTEPSTLEQVTIDEGLFTLLDSADFSEPLDSADAVTSQQTSDVSTPLGDIDSGSFIVDGMTFDENGVFTLELVQTDPPPGALQSSLAEFDLADGGGRVSPGQVLVELGDSAASSPVFDDRSAEVAALLASPEINSALLPSSGQEAQPSRKRNVYWSHWLPGRFAH
ncbi:uncharacterized transmembrane protein DDB_G0289901-like [Pollicipes pollicipes]|uniref:uncharacterized transmembrane protein DDB_G0289901-like n=1 Tax=Pollicipes pollicipes TaxID=41117 RepID=UPI001884AB32|nr:uncharacterized transmembrane protein DDB_G0289901-like [Pollicipes pollicipes]